MHETIWSFKEDSQTHQSHTLIDFLLLKFIGNYFFTIKLLLKSFKNAE